MPSIFIPHRYIARFQKAVLIEAVAGSFCILPITQAYVRPTNVDLTSFVRTDLFAIIIDEFDLAVRVDV